MSLPTSESRQELLSFAPIRAEPDQHSGVFLWKTGSGTQYLTATREGEQTTREAPQLHRLLDAYEGIIPEYFMVNVQVSAEELGLADGSLPLESLPASVINEYGYVRPMAEPFADPGYPPDRYAVRGVQDGRFGRTTGSASCVPIYFAPALDSEVVHCLGPGVLLGVSTELDDPTLQLENPEAWRQVHYDGDFGYAESRFIED